MPRNPRPPEPPGVAQQRIRLALQQYQYRHGHGSQTRLADILGIHQTHVSSIIDGRRDGGLDVMIGIIEKLGSSFFFFSAPVLPHPQFQFDDPPPGTTLERDEDPRARTYPEFERYIAEHQLDRTEEGRRYAEEIRGVRYYRGKEQATYEVAEGIHRGAKARDAGRELRQLGMVRKPRRDVPRVDVPRGPSLGRRRK